MGCNSNTASLEINKKFKKSSFYQRQWACYFEYSVEPKSEQRGTRGGLCCWEGAGPRSLLLQSVQCPSLRVFYAGIGKKETLFSKNSALSQLDKHLKIKAAQLKLAVHPHSFVSLFIFFPHPSTCVLQPMVIAVWSWLRHRGPALRGRVDQPPQLHLWHIPFSPEAAAWNF